MTIEQMRDLQNQFKLYLENKYPDHAESTYDTKKSDAFYPLRHPNVGMEYNDVYSSRENLKYYCELFESYWIDEKKKNSKSIGAYKKAFKDFFDFIHENTNPDISETETTRTMLMISRVNRNIRIADILKNDYENRCQICENRLQIGRNKFYSEAHHIIPLGEPHNGRDIRENMLVVCPNCHTQLDRGFIEMDLSEMFVVENHNIDVESLSYHNSVIFKI